MRKSLLLAIVCFLILSLCGCSAINYFVCENEKGNISYGVIFIFYEDKFKTSQDFTDAKVYTTNKLIEQGLLTLEKAKQIESESEDENFKINIIAKLNNVDISTFASINQNIITITNEQILAEIKSSSEFIYSVVFKSIDDYSAFNSGSTSAESTEINEKTFFEIKKGSKRTINFASTIESLSYIYEIKTKFASYLKEGTSDIDYNKINFSYSYITPHRQIKSNASTIEKSGELYYHTWLVDSNTMTANLEIYSNYPNPVGYYVTSLALSVALTLIFIGVHLCKNIKNKSKTVNTKTEIINNKK